MLKAQKLSLITVATNTLSEQLPPILKLRIVDLIIPKALSPVGLSYRNMKIPLNVWFLSGGSTYYVIPGWTLGSFQSFTGVIAKLESVEIWGKQP